MRRHFVCSVFRRGGGGGGGGEGRGGGGGGGGGGGSPELSLEEMRRSRSRISDANLFVRFSSWGKRVKLYAPVLCSCMEAQ